MGWMVWILCVDSWSLFQHSSNFSSYCKFEGCVFAVWASSEFMLGFFFPAYSIYLVGVSCGSLSSRDAARKSYYDRGGFVGI